MKKWDEIDYDDQEALLEWYNVKDPDDQGKNRLAKLFSKNQFSHWVCPYCETEILVGEPDDWGHFQVVNKSEHYGQLCGECASLYLRLKEYAED